MSTSKVYGWDSSVHKLSPTKNISKNLQKLIDAGYEKISDLLWIFPLRVQSSPGLSDFSSMQNEQLFYGEGSVVNIKASPAFGRRGKGKIQLFNISVVAKDTKSNNYITLKWFNSYPNVKKQIDQLETFTFFGQVSEFRGTKQITNPKLNVAFEEDELLIEYPTINTVPGSFTQKLISRIPAVLWEQELASLFSSLYHELSVSNLKETFKVIHGRTESFSKEKLQEARSRLIYEEFLRDRLKVLARRATHHKKNAVKLKLEDKVLQEFIEMFPYKLTDGQEKALGDIKEDFESGRPMMRILQGDVGCGKTTVALIASYMALKNNTQVAIMCPTEALALQHAEEFHHYLGKECNIALLLGSTKPKAKKEILAQLSSGEVQLIIGTHSLFQDSVEFKNLKFVVIDEQHKFGVQQRLRLIEKGENPHTLIMSATPIPRTLQLAQFGDLDISTIYTIPEGRKGTQTRIVGSQTYEKFLSFIKTRVSIQEQVYIVVPAIEESELDIANINKIEEEYRNFFPELKIRTVHGQLSPQDKENTLNDFKNKKTNILISTSVIEVGINIINATVMAIYNPERFGLSSLHQLRGRVGRGDKPGFCFLITDKKTSQEAIQRLKVLEKSSDGFEIAEADLQNRGQGDLFGVNQSGMGTQYRFANIITHRQDFDKVIQDMEKLQKNAPHLLSPIIDYYQEDSIVSATI